LKDVIFESASTKEYLLKFNKLTTDLAKTNRESYQESGLEIEDTFNVRIYLTARALFQFSTEFVRLLIDITS
jgi:hypothetical protein